MVAPTAPPRRRHRGIQFVGVGVSVLFLGALVLVLLSNSRVQGSIPGSDSILSLAAIHQGFLVGTAAGVLQSPDGKTWLAATNIPREPVAVASDGTTSYVLAGGTPKKNFLGMERRAPVDPKLGAAVKSALDKLGATLAPKVEKKGFFDFLRRS